MDKISENSELNSDMDGVLHMVELNGQCPVTRNYLDSDLYSAASGKKLRKPIKKLKTAAGNTKVGSKLKGFGSGIKNFVNKAQANRELKIKSKFGAKDKEAQAKIETAKAIAKQDDTKLLAALNTKPQKKAAGIGTVGWIAISVVAAGLLGGIIYVVVKKKKK